MGGDEFVGRRLSALLSPFLVAISSRLTTTRASLLFPLLSYFSSDTPSRTPPVSPLFTDLYSSSQSAKSIRKHIPPPHSWFVSVTFIALLF